MGFLDKLVEAVATPQTKMLKRLQETDFKADKEYWTSNFKSAVLVDTKTSRIALLEYVELGFMESGQLISQIDPLASKGKGYLEKNALFRATGKDAQERVKIYAYKDILRSEIVEDGNSVTYTKRLSQLGSALVGEALAGGLGFVVGGLSGKKKNVNTVTTVSLNIIIRDIEKPLFTITFLNKEQEKKSKDYQVAIGKAKELHSLISVLIDLADKEDEKAAKPSAFSGSVADELLKLNQLLEKGIITQEEFASLKANLLSKS